jgi:hypothetical protein
MICGRILSTPSSSTNFKLCQRFMNVDSICSNYILSFNFTAIKATLVFDLKVINILTLIYSSYVDLKV